MKLGFITRRAWRLGYTWDTRRWGLGFSYYHTEEECGWKYEGHTIVLHLLCLDLIANGHWKYGDRATAIEEYYAAKGMRPEYKGFNGYVPL